MSMNTLITLEVKFHSAVLCEGLGLGLEFFKKVLTTTLLISMLMQWHATTVAVSATVYSIQCRAFQ